jgi:hypothetical protein
MGSDCRSLLYFSETSLSPRSAGHHGYNLDIPAMYCVALIAASNRVEDNCSVVTPPNDFVNQHNRDLYSETNQILVGQDVITSLLWFFWALSFFASFLCFLPLLLSPVYLSFSVFPYILFFSLYTSTSLFLSSLSHFFVGNKFHSTAFVTIEMVKKFP